jgi:hypothetical protein
MQAAAAASGLSSAWAAAAAATAAQVTVVVDNETDGLSGPCACCDASLDTSERAGACQLMHQPVLLQISSPFTYPASYLSIKITT